MGQREVKRHRTIIVFSYRYYYQVEAGLWQNPDWGDTPIEKNEETAGENVPKDNYASGRIFKITPQVTLR